MDRKKKVTSQELSNVSEVSESNGSARGGRELSERWKQVKGAETLTHENPAPGHLSFKKVTAWHWCLMPVVLAT
jgi:hypothetical protein